MTEASDVLIPKADHQPMAGSSLGLETGACGVLHGDHVQHEVSLF